MFENTRVMTCVILSIYEDRVSNSRSRMSYVVLHIEQCGTRRNPKYARQVKFVQHVDQARSHRASEARRLLDFGVYFFNRLPSCQAIPSHSISYSHLSPGRRDADCAQLCVGFYVVEGSIVTSRLPSLYRRKSSSNSRSRVSLPLSGSGAIYDRKVLKRSKSTLRPRGRFCSPALPSSLCHVVKAPTYV